MKVVERVEEILENLNLSSEINKESEKWNIMYNLRNDLGVKATDELDESNEELMNHLYAYEVMYHNNFPKQDRSKLNEDKKAEMKMQGFFYLMGTITGALIVKLFF